MRFIQHDIDSHRWYLGLELKGIKLIFRYYLRLKNRTGWMRSVRELTNDLMPLVDDFRSLINGNVD